MNLCKIHLIECTVLRMKQWTVKDNKKKIQSQLSHYIRFKVQTKGHVSGVTSVYITLNVNIHPHFLVIATH